MMTKEAKILRGAVVSDKNGTLHSNQSIVIDKGLIIWCGAAKSLPEIYQNKSYFKNEECGQKLITPGLIDCHTHLIYSGNRIKELQQRLDGESYSAIAKKEEAFYLLFVRLGHVQKMNYLMNHCQEYCI